jgi:hypothetical protein
VAGIEHSPGADVAGVSPPSPGADVAGGENSPGADVAGDGLVQCRGGRGEPSPGADGLPVMRPNCVCRMGGGRGGEPRLVADVAGGENSLGANGAVPVNKNGPGIAQSR